MLLPLSAASLLLPTLVLSATPKSQLYFSPPLASSSSSSRQISLTAPQANAVLAHHLGVSSYVDLPFSSSKQGGRDWEQTLETPPAQDSTFVIVLECPKQGCQDLLPTSSVHLSQPYQLPSLPSNSYLAAVTLHLHRLAESLHLSPDDSPHVKGLKRVVEQGLKSVAGWQGWVGKELASWIGYDRVDDRRFKVDPILGDAPEDKGGLLSDLDFLDQSGRQLSLELENLVQISDSFTSAQELPKIVIVHLKGLQDIAAKHSPSSQQFQKAQALLQQTLSAAIESYQSLSQHQDAKTILLTLPPSQTPLLRKRQPWLHPFESPVSRYTSRTRSLQSTHQNLKRSVFTSSEEKRDDGEEEPKRGRTKIVPTSSRCFKSLEDLNNQTASCLSHGEGVKGISTRGADQECWVCQCGSTVDEDTGKKTYWAGEGCEKVDLSGSFSLLFFSSLGLILILVASVTLLYKVGSVELPGTLSAVGGTGGGHIKRD